VKLNGILDGKFLSNNAHRTCDDPAGHLQCNPSHDGGGADVWRGDEEVSKTVPAMKGGESDRR
jgi:hypothetical protein